MKNKINSPFIISILIPLAVGSISALLSGNMSQYSTLNRPAFSPPALVFPIVWTILYILMGISSYLVYKTDDPQKSKALRIYILQLVFNFFWSILFFGFSQYLLAFFWLLILILLIIIMIYRFYQVSPLAAYLQIPHLFWCLFAAYLNFMIFLMN
ncbi:tryptophan-rich sensory protein [Faecalicatena sp. AGMB00832]|uniref:Tryptophan-rich sensory protein n=1 Tax=Faecalicatena faecalis TaxID=2726362 RepID=A0ABS6CYZ5_9FIRM|nr:TspO/MBR family protein [Faecalicatena faecalis]MBU3874548.1 tryptophan-rich sensory protein [Faecalicatena faecalis]